MSTPRSQRPLSVCVSPTVDCFPDLTSAIELSIVRSVMIAAGIVAALLVNSLLFPRHCRVCVLRLTREVWWTDATIQVLFLSDTSRTLGLLSSLYLTLSQ